MRRALYVALISGLFLLALSALVVSPQEDADTSGAPMYPAQAQAAFLPCPPAVDSVAQARPADWRPLFACLCVCFACALPRAAQCDSNGRVLRAARYENSVYQVFRPEVAGG